MNPEEKSARDVRVKGLVQGVGFRPTVYRIALELGLSGYVYNDVAGVLVHLEGDPGALDAFKRRLIEEKPPLARIDSVEEKPAAFEGLPAFTIHASPEGGEVKTAITADASTCRECFTDVFTRGNRRHLYAFTNCTHCGPRYTITRRLPYDRAQTSMASFPMCPECAREYADPLDRRFHAQPTACPECGPQLEFMLPDGSHPKGDPLELAANVVRSGGILAVKGLGGFHLVVDALDAKAVKRLRERKARDEKPLALMVANIPSAREIALVDPAEEAVMTSPAHPIVLLEKKRSAPAMPGIADGLAWLGIMLPYTPLHALLFHELCGRPEGTDWFFEEAQSPVLVMTSANFSGEPLVIDNTEARERLSGIADAFLMHDRAIVCRCDDSVVRVVDGRTVFIRRARGWAPEAVKLPVDTEKHAGDPEVVAFGPYLKNTGAFLRANEAFLTPHVGSLRNQGMALHLVESLRHLREIFELKPTLVSSDVHPDFPSTRLARQWAVEHDLPWIPIYHHAAHVGVVMAETGRVKPTFGLALDGVGLGPSRGIWGGEALLVESRGFRRIGHLTELALPGGDKAALEPWRMGAAIMDLVGAADFARRFPRVGHIELLPKLIANPRLSPRTSSMGRWYDGASALLGLALKQNDEATAAMLLESAAHRARIKAAARNADTDETWDVPFTVDDRGVLDLAPLARALVDFTAEAGFDPERGAMLFENTLAELTARWAVELRSRLVLRGLVPETDRLVAAGGGCLMNARLMRTLVKRLSEAGLEAALPSKTPPGDGGLALGEAWLAAAAHRAGEVEHAYLGEMTRRA